MEVSFLSQFFSIPVVTDKNTSISQTTRDITKTDITDIKAVDRDFFLGSRYLKAMKNSNKFILTP
jgi:hypothetical protein